jgi:hypothetical protein
MVAILYEALKDFPEHVRALKPGASANPEPRYSQDAAPVSWACHEKPDTEFV